MMNRFITAVVLGTIGCCPVGRPGSLGRTLVA